MAKSWGNPDMALLPFLQHGVPTGAVSALPDSALPPDLEICEGNWKMAEDEPETVQGLLRNEIANNWIVETSLSIADAQGKMAFGHCCRQVKRCFCRRERATPCRTAPCAK